MDNCKREKKWERLEEANGTPTHVPVPRSSVMTWPSLVLQGRLGAGPYICAQQNKSDLAKMTTLLQPIHLSGPQMSGHAFAHPTPPPGPEHSDSLL